MGGALLGKDGIRAMHGAYGWSTFLLVLGILVIGVEWVLGSRVPATQLSATTSAGPTYLPCIAVRSIVVDGERTEISRVALQRATVVALAVSAGTVVVHELLRNLSRRPRPRSPRSEHTKAPSGPGSSATETTGSDGALPESQLVRGERVILAGSKHPSPTDRWGVTGIISRTEGLHKLFSITSRLGVLLLLYWAASYVVGLTNPVCAVQAGPSEVRCLLDGGDGCNELGGINTGDYFQLSDVVAGVVSRPIVTIFMVVAVRPARHARALIPIIVVVNLAIATMVVGLPRHDATLRSIRGIAFAAWPLGDIFILWPAFRRLCRRLRMKQCCGCRHRDRVPEPSVDDVESVDTRSTEGVTAPSNFTGDQPADAADAPRSTSWEFAAFRAQWRLDVYGVTMFGALVAVGLLWTIHSNAFEIPSVPTVQGLGLMVLVLVSAHRMWVICNEMSGDILVLEREAGARRMRKAQEGVLEYVTHELHTPLHRIVHAITDVEEELGNTASLAYRMRKRKVGEAGATAVGGSGHTAEGGGAPTMAPLHCAQILARSSTACMEHVHRLRGGVQDIAKRVRDASTALQLSVSHSHIPLKPAPFPPAAFTTDVVMATRALAAQRAVRVDVAQCGLLWDEASRRLRDGRRATRDVLSQQGPAPCPHVVLCDGARLVQAGTNLLMTAIAHAHTGSCIELHIATRLLSDRELLEQQRLRPAGNEALAAGLQRASNGWGSDCAAVAQSLAARPHIVFECQVCDAGRCATEEALGRVLRPSDSPRAGSLSISIARLIVEGHNGRLYGFSSGSGEGVTLGFATVLPCAQQSDLQPWPGDHGAPRGPSTLQAELKKMQRRGEDLVGYVDRALATTSAPRSGGTSDSGSLETYAPSKNASLRRSDIGLPTRTRDTSVLNQSLLGQSRGDVPLFDRPSPVDTRLGGAGRLSQRDHTPESQGPALGSRSKALSARAEDSDGDAPASWSATMQRAAKTPDGGGTSEQGLAEATAQHFTLAPLRRTTPATRASSSSSSHEYGGSGGGGGDGGGGGSDGTGASRRGSGADGVPDICMASHAFDIPVHRHTRSGVLGRTSPEDSGENPLPAGRIGSRSYSVLDAAATGSGASSRVAPYWAAGLDAPPVEFPSSPRQFHTKRPHCNS